ncbi:amidohydrolase family protein, partial [Acidimicrobiaceae bacterium USS-CC1]|nr:amidohydrolase family protein [Acidiferrimicrobium australe]
AAIDAGYAFDPCHHGHEYHAPEELADLIGRAHAAGLQTGTHAQGDRAIRVALDAIELAQASAPRPDARHRIEHCGLPGAANIARMAALGAVAVNQPQHHYLYGEAVAAAVGPAGRNYNPLGSLRRAGVAIALSSDAPVAPPDPLRAISTAVTRRTVSGAVLGDPGEALTVEQALAAHTIGAARAMRREAAIGSIEPGKLADLVVLDRNPLRCDPDELPGLAVSRLPAVAP